MLTLPVTVRLPQAWIAPPLEPDLLLATLWQSPKCISAEDWMKACSSNSKHGPSKEPKPFTKSLPSKRAVFRKSSGALRSSVAPWWGTVSKMIHDNDGKTTKISSYQNCQNCNDPTSLIHKSPFLKLKLKLFFQWLVSFFWSFGAPRCQQHANNTWQNGISEFPAIRADVAWLRDHKLLCDLHV